MKKVLLSAAIALTSVAVMGQSLVSKKGEPILPQSLDYAIGFDAVPLFNALKFNNGNTISAASPISEFTFFGKRFDSENSACRFTLMLSTNTAKETNLTPSLDAGAPDGGDMVEDVTKFNNFGIMLGFGNEFRRGNTRIQGYWGAESFAGISTAKNKFEYGNDRDDLADGDYNVEVREGTNFRLTARGFMGVEYFVAPKFSIGLEYGIAASLAFQGQGEATTFTVEAGDAGSEQTNNVGSKSTAFGVNTDVAGGRVVALFHF